MLRVVGPGMPLAPACLICFLFQHPRSLILLRYEATVDEEAMAGGAA